MAKESLTRRFGMRWTSVHCGDIFMGQMCYGDFYCASNLRTFFKYFLQGPMRHVFRYHHICMRVCLVTVSGPEGSSGLLGPWPQYPVCVTLHSV